MTEDDFHERENLLLSQLAASQQRIDALQARLDANWKAKNAIYERVD